jgi:hypothetical protein
LIVIPFLGCSAAMPATTDGPTCELAAQTQVEIELELTRIREAAPSAPQSRIEVMSAEWAILQKLKEHVVTWQAKHICNPI